MTGFDMTETTAPKSDQQNFDDYISGPKTVTVSEVRAGSAEQPVDIHLVEFPGRPFRPSKSMRRVLVAAWGPDASVYAGRRMTLFGDPTVRFGGSVVGGIRISNLSHIDKTLTLSLTTTRGKRAPYIVQPLADAPVPAQAAPTADELIDAAQKAGSDDELNRIARKAVAALTESDLDAVKSVVTARRAELKDAEPTLPGAEST